MTEMLDKIQVYYEDGHRKTKCFCGKVCNITIMPHIRQAHPEEWEEWSKGFVKLKGQGVPPRLIIQKYKTHDGKLLFTNSVVERGIREIIEQKKAKLKVSQKHIIEEWEPPDFSLKRTTVWDFPRRGEWAVHQNDYRGNWPPLVPRNLILRYSNKGETILDPFVGGGTTLIEAWLNGRKSFGLDVSPIAIRTTQERIKEMDRQSRQNCKRRLAGKLKPLVIKGDAREVKHVLSKFNVDDGSVKLACLHPPYLNSLRYTDTIEEDLSHISDENVFCTEIQKVASQIYDLVADDGICAVLIGDVKRKKKVVPLGFMVMQRFQQQHFRLKDIIIKVQHKDSSTRFWYTKRQKIDYLIAHEYLFIFSKS